MTFTSWRRARRIRPGCESLEGRDLQAVAFGPLSPLLRVAPNPQPLPPRY
jgi:hypothetical protein